MLEPVARARSFPELRKVSAASRILTAWSGLAGQDSIEEGDPLRVPSIRAAGGLRVVNLAASERHYFEDPFEPECRFFIRPSGFAIGLREWIVFWIFVNHLTVPPVVLTRILLCRA
jgi:hypothetical protein